MREIRIGDTRYSVPGSWDEMTQAQLLALARITERCQTTIEIQLKFFLACTKGTAFDRLGEGMYILEMDQAKHMLFVDEVTAIISVFDYLFETNEKGESSLAPKLTVNHFPKLWTRFSRLYGPGDALDNITYNQFGWLQTYQNLLAPKKLEYLDQLINIIYKTKGGKQSVSNVRKINRHIKTVILWYYFGALNYLSERFTNALSGSSDGQEINVFDNHQRTIDSLAEGDVTKKEQVRESYLYDALYSMEMAALRMQEMEKQQSK